MYNPYRFTCEKDDLVKPGKNDSAFSEPLKMVTPDCDKKRTGPCKPLTSSLNLKGK